MNADHSHDIVTVATTQQHHEAKLTDHETRIRLLERVLFGVGGALFVVKLLIDYFKGHV